MKDSAIIKVFFLLLFISTTSYSQISVQNVALEAGLMRNLTPVWYSETHLTFYPELNIRGSIIKDKLGWGLLIGYWDDGIDELYQSVTDTRTFSYNSIVSGIYLTYNPKILKNYSYLQMMFNFGLSWHNIDAKYIGGGYAENEPDRKNFQEDVYTIDTGINFIFYSTRNLDFYLQPTMLWNLNKYRVFEEGIRFQIVLGISWRI